MDIAINATIVPVVIGLNALVGKYIPAEYSRFLPLSAIVIAIGISLLIGGVDVNSILIGIVTGLSSAGVYDVGKKSILNK